MSQSILVQKQRLDHLLVKSGHAAEEKKKWKKKLEQKASPDGCSSYPAEFLLCFKELSVLRLSEKRIFDSLPLLPYQTATSHQKFASGVHDNLRKQGEK